MVMLRRFRALFFLAVSLSFLVIPCLIDFSVAQGLQTSPYRAADEVRRGLFPTANDLDSSNPVNLPGSSYLRRESEAIPISTGLLQGLLPKIPNLELGYIYNFGPEVRAGRGTVDYLLPINLDNNSNIFGEAHAEFQSFWQTRSGAIDNRVDLSFGGGYRTILRNNTLVGLNGFYDTSRVFNSWYSSGGVGVEMAALTPGNGAIDLNVNWYGNLFTRQGILNAFRNKGGSYDIEAGYSQPLFNQALDLRLKLTGYQYDIGRNVYGWRTGADLTTRDGLFTLRYDYGQDKVNGSYNSVGGFINVGFQPENILYGRNPFVAPEPIFQSPRNVRRMLTQKVKRDWHQPAAVIGAKSSVPASAPAGTSPYFIVTFRDNVPAAGTIQVQTHGETISTVVVRPGSPFCAVRYDGGGYEIAIGGDRPAGDITVNVNGTIVYPPGFCRYVYDGVRGQTFSVTIPSGTSSINLLGTISPWLSYATTCNCTDTPVSNLAGTMTFTDPSGRIPTQTISFYTTP